MTRLQLVQRHHRTTSIDAKPQAQQLQLAISLLLGACVGMVSGLALALAMWLFLTPVARQAPTIQPPQLVRAAGRLLGNVVIASAPLARGAESTVAGSPLVPFTAASSHVRRNARMSASPEASSGYTHRVLSTGWSTPQNISLSAVERSAKPVVVTDRRGVVHVLWEESGRICYRQRVKGQWSETVPLITGKQPAAAIAPNGALYVLFMNEHDGKVNVQAIRYVDNKWTLPRLVSRTTGLSTFPSAAVDNKGVVHVVWTDRTPGYNAIYHGWFDEAWLYEPVPNARGTAPVLTVDSTDGALHIAWQGNQVAGSLYEVYHLQGTTYTWSIPENISVSPRSDSVAVAMVSDQQGVTHLAWQENIGGRSEIRYSGGRPGYWSAQQTVSAPDVDARAPAMVVTHGNQLNLIWREGNTIVYRRRSGSDASWRPSRPLLANDAGLEDLAISADPDGTFHIAWNAWTGADEPDIFFSNGEPALLSHVYLPTSPVSR